MNDRGTAQNDLIFIERMTVLGRGLIFKPVLASLPYTQTCTFDSDTIIEHFGITDFPSKLFKTKNKTKQNKTKTKTKQKTHDAIKWFDMILKMSTLHVKTDKGQNQMKNITGST